MGKKRTRLEVVKDILYILQKNKSVKITHLIYKSNLSNNSIKPYLNSLAAKGLIERDKNTNFFKITEKGDEFLREFSKIKVFSESFGLGDYS